MNKIDDQRIILCCLASADGHVLINESPLIAFRSGVGMRKSCVSLQQSGD